MAALVAMARAARGRAVTVQAARAVASRVFSAEAAGTPTPGCPYHSKPLPLADNGGLQEYSVVYTDRALNHMSSSFCKVMRSLQETLTSPEVYNCAKAVMLPGSGTYAMEAVARQLCSGKKALVVRNGYFSYRWTDIFDQTSIVSEAVIVKAQPTDDSQRPQFTPPPIDELVAKIKAEKPAVVFAPHVETSTGIMLPDDYVKQMADAAHSVGAQMVLDCIASGTMWVDMKATGVDVIITAPQKGWTGPACIGIAMLSENAVNAVNNTTSNSMVLNLRKWLEVADSYTNGGFMYYATMPTDAMVLFNNVANETKEYGFDKVKTNFYAMGMDVRKMMAGKGYKSVAAPGVEAPGVVVSYTDESTMFAKFKGIGMQIAAGVPFMINEPQGNNTFRIGLFGIDKVYNHEKVVKELSTALDTVGGIDEPKAASA